MNIAVARIRNAAYGLQRSKQQVTVATIAEYLKAPERRVKNYIDHIIGLKAELRLIKSPIQNLYREDIRRDKYFEAVHMLHERNIVITTERLAVLAKTKLITAHSWFRRHGSQCPYPITTSWRIRNHRRRRRVYWLSRLFPDRPFTMEQLAEILGMDRCTLARLRTTIPECELVLKHAR